MTDEILRAGLVDHRNPIERGTRAILHRGYHLELEDDYGGISQGEFLLRSDGAPCSSEASCAPWSHGQTGPVRCGIATKAGPVGRTATRFGPGCERGATTCTPRCTRSTPVMTRVDTGDRALRAPITFTRSARRETIERGTQVAMVAGWGSPQ